MTMTEKAMLVLVVIVLWGLSTCVRADHGTAPVKPNNMLIQPMDDLEGWSKLCQPVFLDGTWGKPLAKCVIIKTPNFDNPKEHMVCDAKDPDEGYIQCGITS